MTVQLDGGVGESLDKPQMGFRIPGDRQWQEISTSDSKWNEQRSGNNPEELALESHSSRFRNITRTTFLAIIGS